MHITTAIREASLTSGLQDIAVTARANISFWGSRRIQARGYEGTAPIDSLADAIMALSVAKHFEFTPLERAIGVQVAKQINRIYNDSKTELSSSNWFKRLCCAIKDFFKQFFMGYIPASPYPFSVISWVGERDGDIDGFNRVFEYYTPAQFLERFGREPAANEMHHVFGCYNRNRFRGVDLARMHQPFGFTN